MFCKLAPYWWPARWRTAAGIAVLLAATGMELLLPWPVKWLIDYVLGTQPPPAWIVRIWPSMAATGGADALLAVCLAALVVAIVHRLATFASHMLLNGVGGELVRQLRCRGYEQFCRLSLADHDRTTVGDSLYRIGYDTQAAMSLVSGALMPLLQGSLVLAGILIIMTCMDLWLTLVAATMALVFWGCIRLFSAKIAQSSRRYDENESVLLSPVESLSSMWTLQAFTRKPDTRLRFGSQARENLSINLSLVKRQLPPSGSIGLALTGGTAAAMWLGGHRVLAAQLSAGDVLVFLAYLGMLYQPLNSVSEGASVLQSCLVQLGRVFDILDAAPAIVDRRGATPPARIRGQVEFRDVSFEYSPGQPILRTVAFAVQPGEIVALVGPTGAGKSTLASLLLRFYDPRSGAVLLDGCDLRDLPLGWLRSQVSVVLQDSLLLSGTIRDNIAYGRPGASLADIRAAARKAHAHEFIDALPDGYDTNVAERGVNLSREQRQRLAIARAFLKNAPILVLDEPTSALDAHTGGALLTVLKGLMQGRTTLIIAHRLSTVRLADRIVVLYQGRLLEQGSHDELIRVDSFYRRLYHAQWRWETPWLPYLAAAASGS